MAKKSGLKLHGSEVEIEPAEIVRHNEAGRREKSRIPALIIKAQESPQAITAEPRRATQSEKGAQDLNKYLGVARSEFAGGIEQLAKEMLAKKRGS